MMPSFSMHADVDITDSIYAMIKQRTIEVTDECSHKNRDSCEEIPDRSNIGNIRKQAGYSNISIKPFDNCDSCSYN